MASIPRWLYAALLIPGAVGCGRGNAEVPAPAPAVTDVAVVSPVRKSFRYTVEQPGRIEPFEQTPIYAKIAGYVRTVHVERGDQVKRGDLLAELDVPELVEEHGRQEALVRQDRVGISQAEQALRVTEAKIVSATADVDVARAGQTRATASLERWQSENQRMDQLVKKGVLDRSNRDEIRSQYRAAGAAKAEADARVRSSESALVEAQASRDLARTNLEAARSRLAVAEADERRTRALLRYTRITAPYDGVVSHRHVDTGHLLHASTGGSKGQPLFVVVRVDKVRVFVEVPEADAVNICAICPGRIRVQALNDREFLGKVNGTSWSLDPTQRTLRTEIDFDNPKGELRPGMYLHAFIDADRKDVWMIPADAVLVRDGVSFCYEVRDGQTHRLPARLGLRLGEWVEVQKFQLPPRQPRERPGWSDPTGKELIVKSKPGELSNNQSVIVK